MIVTVMSNNDCNNLIISNNDCHNTITATMMTAMMMAKGKLITIKYQEDKKWQAFLISQQ